MSAITSVRGTYTGTGAAVNVELGFEPDEVEIWNFTDGDELYKWNAGMGNGFAMKIDAAVSKLSSNGISVYSGSRGSAAKGFTAGTSVSENAKVFHYVARRTGL